MASIDLQLQQNVLQDVASIMGNNLHKVRMAISSK